jgi:hypothetical protein
MSPRRDHHRYPSIDPTFELASAHSWFSAYVVSRRSLTLAPQPPGGRAARNERSDETTHHEPGRCRHPRGPWSRLTTRFARCSTSAGLRSLGGVRGFETLADARSSTTEACGLLDPRWLRRPARPVSKPRSGARESVAFGVRPGGLDYPLASLAARPALGRGRLVACVVSRRSLLNRRVERSRFGERPFGFERSLLNHRGVRVLPAPGSSTGPRRVPRGLGCGPWGSCCG